MQLAANSKSMKYEATDEEKRFLEYYDKLIWEILFARAHLKLRERLDYYRNEYHRELNQASHFFTLTMRAHWHNA
jgi:hypothetical protein